jgi:hypothetical protein
LGDLAVLGVEAESKVTDPIGQPERRANGQDANQRQNSPYGGVFDEIPQGRSRFRHLDSTPIQSPAHAGMQTFSEHSLEATPAST